MGLNEQLEQIIQIEHDIAKNLKCSEANQLAIYKVSRGFEIQVVVRAGLEPVTAGLRVPHADHLATKIAFLLTVAHAVPTTHDLPSSIF